MRCGTSSQYDGRRHSWAWRCPLLGERAHQTCAASVSTTDDPEVEACDTPRCCGRGLPQWGSCVSEWRPLCPARVLGTCPGSSCVYQLRMWLSMTRMVTRRALPPPRGEGRYLLPACRREDVSSFRPGGSVSPVTSRISFSLRDSAFSRAWASASSLSRFTANSRSASR